MITKCGYRWLTSVVLALTMLLSAAKGLPGQQTSNARAQESVTTPKKYSWKPEDVIFQELASEFLISPDNKWVVWVKSTARQRKRRTRQQFISFESY